MQPTLPFPALWFLGISKDLFLLNGFDNVPKAIILADPNGGYSQREGENRYFWSKHVSELTSQTCCYSSVFFSVKVSYTTHFHLFFLKKKATPHSTYSDSRAGKYKWWRVNMSGNSRAVVLRSVRPFS